MNYLDLFHGIGGFALGAYWAGMKFEHHYCSDIEPWCQKLYAQRFPDSVQLGDITKIDTSKLPAGEWIITGGFPCQDISIAGKGAGIHGERSGLWFEYWRIINDLRPRFAIMENVGMLVHRGLREVLGSLAEIGYNAEWQDIRASDMGAPHKRERIWIIAYPASIRRATGGNFKPEHKHNISKIREASKNQQPRNKWECWVEQICPDKGTSKTETNVADTESIGGRGFQGFKRHEETERAKNNNRKQHDRIFPHTTSKGLEREKSKGRDGRRPGLSAECSQWSTEPDVGMLVNGISVKLDGGLGHAGMESEKSCTEGASKNGKMRMVRSNGNITETSPGHKKRNGNNNIVSEVPCKSGQDAWNEEIKTDAEMCSMRENIQSIGQPCSQNLQLRLSENPRERKRIEAVAWECEPIEIGRLTTGVKNRVDRLRGLGNAIVPQIAELLFRQIKPLL